MGVFDDKKFEQLDWMTQITETIDSELNGLLARLPDEKEIDAVFLLSALDRSYSLSFSSGDVVRKMVRELTTNLNYSDETELVKCFEFEASPDLEINFATMEMTGTLKLVKKVKTIEDEDLQKRMGDIGVDELLCGTYNETMLGRAVEIMDLVDAPRDRTRSTKKKVRVICRRLEDIFATNEWRIRDMTLANKVGIWCKEYITKGMLSALVNLSKLKVMTHNNMPIYSIEEEE